MSNEIMHGVKRSGRMTVAVVLGAILLWGSAARAQVAGGAIQGTITDKSGGVIPQVKVSIKNLATNNVTVVNSNADGFYTAPSLLPGQYEITAEAPNFAVDRATGITLTVGAQQQVNLTLSPSSVQQTVTVTTAPPDVELATSTISDVIDSKTMRELPLNARDWTQLATLEPGVAALHTQVVLSSGPDRGNRGFGTQLTISGGRPAQNNYRLDGVSINDYSNGAPGSVLGVNLGVDAVEEFSVLTSNYSAEYGRTSGGVVNAITRSGSKNFHGDVYEFIRNSALDARNFFDGVIPPFKRNQFGASAGGPLLPGRTFIFGDYEGLRQSLGQTLPITVPSLAARALATPAIAPFLNFFPLPTSSVDALHGSANSVIQQVTSENYFTTRVDHKFSERNNLSGTYVFDSAQTTQPDPLLVVLTGNRTRRQILSVQDSQVIHPEFLNTVRFGFSRVVAFAGQNVNAINPLATDITLGAVPNRPAPGIVFGDNTVTFPGGLGASPNYQFHWNSFQLYDDAFLTKGIHAMKFGFSLERIQNNILASSDSNGVVTYPDLSTFLANGIPQNFNAAIPGSITDRELRQSIYAGYFQDDIHLRPNLTVNAGLRYEISTVPTEVHGRLSTLRNLTDAQPHLGSPYFSNPTLHNFEPRVGFAWDPFKDGKTAIRGGFGMFDVLPLPYLYELLVPLAAPFYQLGNSSNLPAGAFPGGLFPLIGNASNLRQSYVQPNPKRNYVMQWNLNVQRQITNSVSGLLAYVGSRGVHQAFRADDINTVQPIDPTSLTPTFPINGTLLNPNVGQISAVAWGSDSHYRALEAQVNLRSTHGLQAQASYTWGNSQDTGSATVGGDTFSNSISSLPFFNERLRKGPSDFNIAQNLVMNFTWLAPSPHDLPALGNWALGGWQVGGVYQKSTGVPFTPNIGGDALGLGSTDPFNFPDLVRGPGCNSLVNVGNVQNYINTNCLAVPNPLNRRGNLPRNAFTGPGLQNFDFSLSKNNHVRRISEAFNVQFRMEFFNIFNHPNFAPPVDHLSVFDQTGAPIASAGQIDSTTTSSRQIQFGLKIIW